VFRHAQCLHGGENTCFELEGEFAGEAHQEAHLAQFDCDLDDVPF
jgi:hypothetical protein